MSSRFFRSAPVRIDLVRSFDRFNFDHFSSGIDITGPWFRITVVKIPVVALFIVWVDPVGGSGLSRRSSISASKLRVIAMTRVTRFRFASRLPIPFSAAVGCLFRQVGVLCVHPDDQIVSCHLYGRVRIFNRWLIHSDYPLTIDSLFIAPLFFKGIPSLNRSLPFLHCSPSRRCKMIILTR